MCGDVGEVIVFSLVVMLLCLAFEISWAATRKQSYSWVGQDILVSFTLHSMETCFIIFSFRSVITTVFYLNELSFEVRFHVVITVKRLVLINTLMKHAPRKAHKRDEPNANSLLIVALDASFFMFLFMFLF